MTHPILTENGMHIEETPYDTAKMDRIVYAERVFAEAQRVLKMMRDELERK
jgi:hypothetical protein